MRSDLEDFRGLIGPDWRWVHGLLICVLLALSAALCACVTATKQRRGGEVASF